MADTPTRIEVNCETGEVKEIPLTEAEIADLDKMRKDAEARQAALEAEAQAIADAKASAIAKLSALGLTENEAKAIVG